MRHLLDLIVAALSPDLLKPTWQRVAQAKGCPLVGHCYAASEAMFHLLGGADKGWVPQVLSHASWPAGLAPGQTHWFLRNARTGEVVDPTAGQFLPLCPDHSAAKGCGFLTRAPSRRAAVLIERVSARLMDTQHAGVVEWKTRRSQTPLP